MECRGLLEKLGLRIVWSDSLGAKSFTLYGSCGERGVLIDPGAAAMHPSFPLPGEEKRRLRRAALEAIAGFVERATLVVITHYHYDHYVRPWDPDYPGPNPYHNRLVVMKNPNVYINESQRARAEELITRLLSEEGVDPREYTAEPETIDVPNPEDEMPETARNTSRGRLEAGRRWFQGLKAKWCSWRWFRSEVRAGRLRLLLSDYGVFEECSWRVRLLGPHFHGDIYERTGWVTPVLLERGGWRVLYTSDLTGPLSEDYTSEIIEAKPHVLVADGPATYLPPYMFSKRDLQRAVSNMLRILREATPELIVWDHHLPREPRWREKVEVVLREAEKSGVCITTVAELMGRRPVVEEGLGKRSQASS